MHTVSLCGILYTPSPIYTYDREKHNKNKERDFCAIGCEIFSVLPYEPCTSCILLCNSLIATVEVAVVISEFADSGGTGDDKVADGVGEGVITALVLLTVVDPSYSA